MCYHVHQHHRQPQDGVGGVERNLQNKRQLAKPDMYYFQVTFALLMSGKGFRHRTYDITHVKNLNTLYQREYTHTHTEICLFNPQHNLLFAVCQQPEKRVTVSQNNLSWKGSLKVTQSNYSATNSSLPLKLFYEHRRVKCTLSVASLNNQFNRIVILCVLRQMEGRPSCWHCCYMVSLPVQETRFQQKHAQSKIRSKY